MIGRIRDRRAIERLSRRGRRARTGALWCRYLEEPSIVPPQVAFAVGRPVGSAVVRNRVRRRLREVLRAATVGDPPKLAHGQLLVGAVNGAGELAFEEMARQVNELLHTAVASHS